MIRIQNLYYMLAYAFQVLNEQGYKSLGTEAFDNTAELFAAILCCGLKKQIKRGLVKEYIPQTEALSSLKGRIDIAESIKTQALLRKQLICNYDEFSTDSYMNRVIKSTLLLLLSSDISKSRKKEIRKLLIFLQDVKQVDVYNINWNFHFNRNNQTYRMLIEVCRLTIKGLLQTQNDGSTKMMDFLDDQRMSHLYEKFILEYFRKHYPQLNPNPSPIKWQLEGEPDSMLPAMKTDIMLTKEQDQDVLIIDAKYYSKTTQEQFGKHTLHSNNLYQVFTYVKNKEYELRGAPHRVSGLLLYAKTDEEIQPDNDYLMSGNRISVKTLDLEGDFASISNQLNYVADSFLNSTECSRFTVS